jgi:hypothetical protein
LNLRVILLGIRLCPLKPEFPLQLNGVDLDTNIVASLTKKLEEAGGDGFQMAEKALGGDQDRQKLCGAYQARLGTLLNRMKNNIELNDLLEARRYEVALAYANRIDPENSTAKNAIGQAMYGRNPSGGSTATGVLARQYIATQHVAAQPEEPRPLERVTAKFQLVNRL